MLDGFTAVRPACAGMNLVHPAGGRALPDVGGLWPSDSFTTRRIKDGGVVVLSEEEYAATQSVEADPVEGAERKVAPGDADPQAVDTVERAAPVSSKGSK